MLQHLKCTTVVIKEIDVLRKPAFVQAWYRHLLVVIRTLTDTFLSVLFYLRYGSMAYVLLM